MGPIESSLNRKLQSTFQPQHLLVVNDSHGHTRGDETHFTVVVVSEKFQGVSRVERQRQVAALFDSERDQGLHALSQKIYTPEEWSKVKDSFELEAPACRGGGKR